MRNDTEFYQIIEDIITNSMVLELKNHLQHYSTTRFEHCSNVAYYTYKICKKLNLDYVSATRGAMLHDFYFYNWRMKQHDKKKRFHAITHPKTALNNAKSEFLLNPKEQDVILKHMWPITLKFPRYLESFIVTWVDKYCATLEFFKYMRHRRKLRYLKMQELTKLYLPEPSEINRIR